MKKKLRATAIMLLAILALTGCSTPTYQGDALKEPEKSTEAPAANVDLTFSMGTSSSGGTVYAVGAGVAAVLNEAIDGLDIRAMSTGGAVDNVGLMSNNEVQFAMNASNTNAMAYNGQLSGMDKQENIRGIASIYPSVFHFVTTADSGITSFADMKGTKGSVGASGSATDVYTQHVLATAGITYDDFDVTYSDASSAADLIKDGHIDWAHFPLGVPGSTVMDLAMTTKINILPIEGDFRNKLIEDYPFYVPYTIPGGTYEGFAEDIESAACVITFVCDESVDEDLVYQITKALWENVDAVKQVNKSCEWMDISHATDGIGVPLHPGAEKYYKEIGALQ